MHFAYIQWRNKESTRIIQQQFALGIETYDRDRDAGRNVKSQSTRDYDALKKEIPVFCTSAKAYQSLQKRRGKEASVPGFDNLEQIEVPKLHQVSNLGVYDRVLFWALPADNDCTALHVVGRRIALTRVSKVHQRSVFVHL